MWLLSYTIFHIKKDYPYVYIIIWAVTDNPIDGMWQWTRLLSCNTHVPKAYSIWFVCVHVLCLHGGKTCKYAGVRNLHAHMWFMWQLHAHYVNCVQYIGAHWAVHIRPVGRNCACDFTCVCIKNELVTHFNSNFSKDAKKIMLVNVVHTQRSSILNFIILDFWFKGVFYSYGVV